MSHGHFDSEVETHASIPLDSKIGEKLRLNNVPTDRSVSRGASPKLEAESLPNSTGRFLSPGAGEQ